MGLTVRTAGVLVAPPHADAVTTHVYAPEFAGIRLFRVSVLEFAPGILTALNCHW